MTNSTIKPGTVAKIISSMPGPECEPCLVTGVNSDGSHDILFKVYGVGNWISSTEPPRDACYLYPSWPFIYEYPSQRPSDDYLNAMRLKAEELGLEFSDPAGDA